MFDVPRVDVSRVEWHADVAVEEHDWQIGLIVGPSGSGKTTMLGELFGQPATFEWRGASVVDDFDDSIPMDDIAATCQAVGFNTIPAWMRPFSVLSNGEQFRVTLARALLEDGRDPIVLDEFTSVVDRQVAQIGSAAVQKYLTRRPGRRLVAASCHYDIVDWLEPDWVLDAATCALKWRRHRGRPSLDVTISAADYSAWGLFAPFHYLTAELNRAAKVFVLFVGDEPAVLCAVLHQPHSKTRNLKRVSRIVTLPDWQGLGLAFTMLDTMGAAYTAHPALIHSMDRSPVWALVKKPATFAATTGRTSTLAKSRAQSRDATSELMNRPGNVWHQGSRPCAVFEFCGEPDENDAAAALLHCDR